jgi:hypothetical protein
MDGSMRYYPGLVRMAGDVHPERMTIPLLFFTQGDPNVLEDIDKYHDGPRRTSSVQTFLTPGYTAIFSP